MGSSLAIPVRQRPEQQPKQEGHSAIVAAACPVSQATAAAALSGAGSAQQLGQSGSGIAGLVNAAPTVAAVAADEEAAAAQQLGPGVVTAQAGVTSTMITSQPGPSSTTSTTATATATVSGGGGGLSGAAAGAAAAAALQTLAAPGGAMGALLGQSNDPQWLSTMLAVMWPHINAMVAKMMWEMLPEMLDQAKPQWITTLGLSKFDLGSTPPKLTNVAAGKGPDPVVSDLYVEADVEWASSDTHIEFSINPLPNMVTSLPGLKHYTTFTVGVVGVSFKGRLHINFVPLLDDIPLIGGMQIAFNEVPKLDPRLVISGGGESLLDYFKPWLINFVEDCALSCYVYPGHIFCPIADGVPDIQTACGVLEVEVLEATNVPALDYLTKSSPYCKLWLTGANGFAKQTPIVDYTRNPVWHERNTFGFAVHSSIHQQLVLGLMDYDYGTADDEIGRVHVPLGALKPGQVEERWLKFVPDDDDDEPPPGCGQADWSDDRAASSARDQTRLEQQQQQQQQEKRAKQALDRTLLSTLVPSANELSTWLPKCRLNLKMTYRPLPQDDVLRLHQAAMASSDDEAVQCELSLISNPTIRELVQRHDLLSQLAVVTRTPPAAPAAPTPGPAPTPAPAT